jgi:hypothetical protein
MRIHNNPDCSNYQIPKQQAIEVYPIVSQRRPVDKKSSIFLLVAAATALVSVTAVLETVGAVEEMN